MTYRGKLSVDLIHHHSHLLVNQILHQHINVHLKLIFLIFEFEQIKMNFWGLQMSRWQLSEKRQIALSPQMTSENMTSEISKLNL